MERQRLRILDADRHVVEPIGMWKDYLDPDLRAYAPYHADMSDAEPFDARVARLGAEAFLPLPPMPMLDGRPLYRAMSERAWLELARAARQRFAHWGRLEEPAVHLADMDREGIDVAILYPTYALLVLGMDLPPALARGFARAYNRWLRNFCDHAPHRLRGAALIAPHAPEQMAPELAWAAEQGFQVAVLRPNPVSGRRLADPAYEPFWSECERRVIPVVIHEGTHAYLPAAGADRFESRFALHACSHPMEQMMALLDLVEGGVLERHPGLRVAFVEAGCGWLPYWLARLDEEYAHLAREVAERVHLAPSAYFRRQCMIAIEPEEPLLPAIIEHVGEDYFCFGTDFPHLDHDANIVKRARALRGRLPERVLGKLLWGNAARFFGIDG